MATVVCHEAVMYVRRENMAALHDLLTYLQGYIKVSQARLDIKPIGFEHLLSATLHFWIEEGADLSYATHSIRFIDYDASLDKGWEKLNAESSDTR